MPSSAFAVLVDAAEAQWSVHERRHGLGLGELNETVDTLFVGSAMRRILAQGTSRLHLDD